MPMTGLGNAGVSVVATHTTSKGMNEMQRQLVIDTGYFRANIVSGHPDWNGRLVVEILEYMPDPADPMWKLMLVIPLDTFLRIAKALLPNNGSLAEDIEQALAAG